MAGHAKAIFPGVVGWPAKGAGPGLGATVSSTCAHDGCVAGVGVRFEASRFMRQGRQRLLAVALLGFSSGLPLSLSRGTLEALLASSGIDLRTIGFMTLLGLPYSIKFLWAPWLDRVSLPFLGHRRGWLLLCQVVLAAGMAALAFAAPRHALWLIAALALLITTTSATQDLLVDAYRTDVLGEAERALGAGLAVSAYRMALLVSGAGALLMADYWGWTVSLVMVACAMAVGMSGTLLAPEPQAYRRQHGAVSLGAAARYLLGRQEAGLALAVVVLYKLGDAFAGSLTTSFFVRGLGLSPGEVGMFIKTVGLGGTLLGAVAGGLWMRRLTLRQGLLLFAMVQVLTNVPFLWLAEAGRHDGLIAVAVFLEQLGGGMGTVALLALMMGLARGGPGSATSFALLSALASLGAVGIGPVAGWVAAHWGWPLFFSISVLCGLPCVVALLCAPLRFGRGAPDAEAAAP